MIRLMAWTFPVLVRISSVSVFNLTVYIKICPVDFVKFYSVNCLRLVPMENVRNVTCLYQTKLGCAKKDAFRENIDKKLLKK